jgi:hypothetical protein
VANYCLGVLRWSGALLTAAVLSGFAVLLLTGEYIRSGPVLVRLSENHGIHRGDLGIVSFWVLGMVGVLVTLLARREPRRARDVSTT